MTTMEENLKLNKSQREHEYIAKQDYETIKMFSSQLINYIMLIGTDYDRSFTFIKNDKLDELATCRMSLKRILDNYIQFKRNNIDPQILEDAKTLLDLSYEFTKEIKENKERNDWLSYINMKNGCLE